MAVFSAAGYLSADHATAAALDRLTGRHPGGLRSISS
jgi:hypothetical protein